MRLKFRYFIIVFFFLTVVCINAQELYAINSVWSDSFSEWSYITVDEEEGSFALRWLDRSDWSEWIFEFNGLHGSLKMKWGDDPNTWELRSGSEVVNIKTKWKNDFSEWRISNGNMQLTFESKYTNSINEWRVKEKKYGTFTLQTEWTDDPRDWNIYDGLDVNIEFEVKLAMTFIAIINSIPKV